VPPALCTDSSTATRFWYRNSLLTDLGPCGVLVVFFPSHRPVQSIYFMAFGAFVRAGSYIGDHDKPTLSATAKRNLARWVFLRSVGPSGMRRHGVDRTSRMGCPLVRHRISIIEQAVHQSIDHPLGCLVALSGPWADLRGKRRSIRRKRTEPTRSVLGLFKQWNTTPQQPTPTPARKHPATRGPHRANARGEKGVTRKDRRLEVTGLPLV
jgi:hypothetical protein